MSVYSANRIHAIKESQTPESDGVFFDELNEAFEAPAGSFNITPFGIIAQIQENENRMFDAIISSDFHIAALKEEGNEEAANKADQATSQNIWQKILAFIKKVKDGIAKAAKAAVDKIVTVMTSDKKIRTQFRDAIAKNGKEVTLKDVAAPKQTFSGISDLVFVTNAVNELTKYAQVVSNSLVEPKDLQVEDICNSFKEKAAAVQKSVDEAFNDSADVTIKPADALKLIDSMGATKDCIAYIKKATNQILNIMQIFEKVVRKAQGKDSKKANEVSKVISAAGKACSSALQSAINAFKRMYAFQRSAAIAAGRAATKKEKKAPETAEEKEEAATEAAMDDMMNTIIFESSSLFISEAI